MFYFLRLIDQPCCLQRRRYANESAQVRHEEAVKRHVRLSGVAQSVLGQAAGQGKKLERLAFAKAKQTVAQRLYTVTPESYHQRRPLLQGLLAQGRTCEHVLEVLMPA